MNKFWDSNCVSPWDCWSIGDFDCMLATPSQNTQESWHNHIMKSAIPGLFRASTENLFADGLPQLIELDGIMRPKVLTYHVPVIPKEKMVKALWYVEHMSTHIQIKEAAPGMYVYYFLSKDNRGKFPKLTKRLIEMYEAALTGTKDARIKDINTLLDVCGSMYMVCGEVEDYGVPECEGNKARLDCPCCKGFKHDGICSHVLAVNHILKRFNVRYHLLPLGKRTDKKKKGPEKAPPKALKRVQQREPDSSDEEEERALTLGQEGR